MDNILYKRLLSRDIVETFCSARNCAGIVACLSYLYKNPADLRGLVVQGGINLTEQQKTLLFHGSPYILEEIKPSKARGVDLEEEQGAFVYATSNPNYAIFLALLDIQEGGTASVFASGDDTKLSLSSRFINGVSQIKNKGFVHIVDGHGFKELENDEYSISSAVSVLCSFEVTEADLSVPIQCNSN